MHLKKGLSHKQCIVSTRLTIIFAYVTRKKNNNPQIR